MRCVSGGIETVTTLREREGEVMTEERGKLAGTLGYGETRRLGGLLAGIGATVGVMALI